MQITTTDYKELLETTTKVSSILIRYDNWQNTARNLDEHVFVTKLSFLKMEDMYKVHCVHAANLAEQFIDRFAELQKEAIRVHTEQSKQPPHWAIAEELPDFYHKLQKILHKDNI